MEKNPTRQKLSYTKLGKLKQLESRCPISTNKQSEDVNESIHRNSSKSVTAYE